MISLITLVSLILLDRITKILAVIYLKPMSTFPLIKDVFHLTYVENTGAAFGMLKDSRWVFMSASVVIILAIVVYLYKNRKNSDRFITFTLCMILSGGIGNMIDRICYGYVIDFIDFCLIDFAVFNIADSALSVGAILLAVYIIFIEPKKSGNPLQNQEEALGKIGCAESPISENEEKK